MTLNSQFQLLSGCAPCSTHYLMNLYRHTNVAEKIHLQRIMTWRQVYYAQCLLNERAVRYTFVGFNSVTFFLFHCLLADDSGTHKQRGPGKGNGSSGQAAAKTLDHAFVTPRVKSAAKSRQAVSLLNEIVSSKDRLLKKAIESMERKERTLLTSKNNDFLKFVSVLRRFILRTTPGTT